MTQPAFSFSGGNDIRMITTADIFTNGDGFEMPGIYTIPVAAHFLEMVNRSTLLEWASDEPVRGPMDYVGSVFSFFGLGKPFLVVRELCVALLGRVSSPEPAPIWGELDSKHDLLEQFHIFRGQNCSFAKRCKPLYGSVGV